ncbi:hypothetical protein HU200_012626 [Digitaria exilis]|uniref:KIB1-4 beta-propeller domain-containing protein n=1 Tax=Digitaria exilis TaxID=1010633 RepID=A0A835FEF5_9POAL|nr:hypothetical protein HU200_012626 [Digitaria exilis]
MVLRRLPAHVDRIRFTAVCSHWRAAPMAGPMPPPPQLLALPDGTVYSVPLSEPFHFPRCAGYTDACANWLVFFSGDDSDDVIILKDPFSDATLALPPLSRNCVGNRPFKAKDAKNLTMDKLMFCSPRLVAAIVQSRGATWIAVCCPGLDSWWSVSIPSNDDDYQRPWFADIVFHDDKLYALDHYQGFLYSVDLQSKGDHPWISRIRRVLDSHVRIPGKGDGRVSVGSNAAMETMYLVESCGDLLMVLRGMFGVVRSSITRRQPGLVDVDGRNQFQVFRADFARSRWTEVSTLGDDQVLFLRRRCCRLVRLSPEQMPGDSIVFMENDDDIRDCYDEESSSSCSVYSMKYGSVSTLLPAVQRQAPLSWSDIPLELAGLVLRCLDSHVDRVRFAAVCPQWRVAAREIPLPPPLPLLALPDGTVYSLPGRRPFHVPACSGYTEACGGNWLLFSGEDGCFLRDPFSNATVTLPALSRVRIRFVGGGLGTAWEERHCAKSLTVRQVKFCTPHLIAARVTFQGTPRVAVCQPGAFSWWSMHLDDQSPIFLNITFHHGNLYALDHCGGALFSMDASIDHNTGDPWISRVRRVIDGSGDAENVIAPDYATFKRRFLVELHGRILMMERVMHHRLNRAGSFGIVSRAWKNEFEVFEANFEQSQWSKVTTIGDDQVLFLRSQCCRFVCVSQYKMLGDQIFFLGNGVKDDMGNGDEDANWYCEERLGPCRVYDMRDSKVSDPLPTVPWTHAFALATWLSPQGLN